MIDARDVMGCLVGAMDHPPTRLPANDAARAAHNSWDIANPIRDFSGLFERSEGGRKH